MKFNIPRKLADLEKEKDNELHASNVPEADSIGPEEIESAFDGAITVLGKGPLDILEQENFESAYLVIRGLQDLDDGHGMALATAMCRNLGVLVTSGLEELMEEGRGMSDPVVVSHRSAIHVYIFFLSCLHEHYHTHAADRQKAEALAKGAAPKKSGGRSKAAPSAGDGGRPSNWPSVEERIVKALSRTLLADLDSTLYRSPVDKFRLVEVCVLTAVRCLDTAVGKQQSILTPCLEIVALAAAKHANCGGSEVTAAALFRLVLENEHGHEVAANAAALAASVHGSQSLCKTLVGKFCEKADPEGYDEIAKRDTKPVKRAADLLLTLAKTAPTMATIHTVISQLIPYFGCQTATAIRISLVGCMGYLMHHYATIELNEKGGRLLQLSRQNAIQTLVTRTTDMNAFVRRAALTTIRELVEKKLWPIEYYKHAVEAAVVRLDDGSTCAGAALELLCSLISSLPADKLTDTHLLASINRFEEQLKDMKPDVVEEGEEDTVGPQWGAGPLGADGSGMEAEETTHTGPEGESQQGIIPPTQLDNGGAGGPANGGGGMTYTQLRMLVATLKALLGLSRMIADALPEVEVLLASESADVTENAIKLLTLCTKRQLQGVEDVWRSVWHLALCGTEKVRNTVLDAFYTFLLSEEGEAGPRSRQGDSSRLRVYKLVEMVKGIALCDKEALDELMRMALTRAAAGQDPMLGPAAVQFMLQNMHAAIGKAALLAGEDSDETREAADLAGRLTILCGMAARHVPETVVSDIKNLVADLKRSHIVIKDAVLVRNLATMLGDLAPALSSPSAKGRIASGYQPESYVPQALANLLSVLVSSHVPHQTGAWPSAAQAAIAALYRLHPEPHRLLEPLMRHLAAEAASGCCPASQLTRTVFIVGCITTQQLALIDSLTKRVRRERNEAEKAAAKAAVDDMEAQLGTGQALDHLLDAQQEELEAKLMGDSSLIGMWGKLISSLCHNPAVLGLDDDLASAAMTTLAKLMAIDAAFCEANCPIFFTRLTGAGALPLKSSVRCNLLVALGDLSRRHPNVMEPWTERMFVCLTDDDEEVSKTCLRILAHLVLSDMTKPKGHMAHVARCLVARSTAVRDLALRLFNSLSSKQARGGANKVYQYLPEIISAVTRGDPMPQQDFKAMMQRLLSYIKVDKLTDSLKGRLCERFENVVCEFSTEIPGLATGVGPYGTAPAEARAAGCSFEDVIREWRSLADCMALLPYTEKGLRACMERMRCYKHALGDEHVYRVFKGMAEHGRRGNRTVELKQEVADYEARLDEAHTSLREEQLEQAAAAAKAAAAKAAAAKVAAAEATLAAAGAVAADAESAGEGAHQEVPTDVEMAANCDTKHSAGGDGNSADAAANVTAVKHGACVNTKKERGIEPEVAAEADDKVGSDEDKEQEQEDKQKVDQAGGAEGDEAEGDPAAGGDNEDDFGEEEDEEEEGKQEAIGEDEGGMDMDCDEPALAQATPRPHRPAEHNPGAALYADAASSLGAGGPAAGTPMAITPKPGFAYTPGAQHGATGDDMAWSPAPSCAQAMWPAVSPAAVVGAAMGALFNENANPVPFRGFRIKPDPEAHQMTAVGPIVATAVVGVRIKPDPDACRR